MRKTIQIKGARENNLKNIDVEIPRETFTVITGVSGSGKSSLAYDIIFAEGQRRLLDSLSAYSRRYIPQPRKADVDAVDGLSPVVAIMQQRAAYNPRSTVGTSTDIYDYLRLLFCVLGEGRCPYCGHAFDLRTVDQLVERLQSLPSGTMLEIRTPVSKIYGEDYPYLFAELRGAGFRQLVIDGQRYDTGDEIPLNEERDYPIEVVIDRLVVTEDLRDQVEAMAQSAMRVGGGFMRFEFLSPQLSEVQQAVFYEGIACPEHHVGLQALETFYFSFNDPDSSCRTCRGLGRMFKAEPRLIVVNPHKSLRQGALAENYLSLGVKSVYRYTMLYSLAEHYGFSLDVPFVDLSEETRRILFYGTRGEKIELVQPPDSERRIHHIGRHVAYEGIVNRIDRWYKRHREEGNPITNDYHVVRKVMAETDCPDCGGKRFRAERLRVTIDGKNIHELATLSLDRLVEFLEGVQVPLRKKDVGEAVLHELITRLRLLVEIGVGYLSLDRGVMTLSGGESQRVRLTTQIGSGLMGMMYILDEPSIGLHPRDSYRIINTLHRLRDVGNTVIVVEHDLETIHAADHVIEMGPGPGVLGGTVVAQGTLDALRQAPDSPTGQFLSGARHIALPETRRSPNGSWLQVVGAREHNLKNLTVRIPLGVLVCVTGVSGSGKSSLIHDILFRTLHARLHDPRLLPGKADAVEGIEQVDSIINIDQSSISRSIASNPSTYVGIFDRIRTLFAGTPLAEERGYTRTTFSFNAYKNSGRCQECKGRGVIVTALQFMPDVETVCPACKGQQYTHDVLDVTWRGRNIAEVLAMSFADAESFFEGERGILRKVRVLNQLGLGYLKLGQSVTTLSGGEAQRIKLVKELAKMKRGHKLYILDEPTTGLHLADIQRLLDCLNSLVDAGHTVIVIEHNLDVLKTADWIIDLGPEGGEEGGFLVAQGAPEQVAAVEASYTGQYLKPVLESS